MVRTRAQEKVDETPKSGATTTPDADSRHGGKETPKKRPHSRTEEKPSLKSSKKTKQRTAKEDDEAEEEEKQPSANHGAEAKSPDTESSKIALLIEKYGSPPLSEAGLQEPWAPKPETLLALLLNAIFSSTRISHDLAAKTIATAIKANYHKLDVLKKTTWDERCQVLTEGGYTRYREKTSTGLSELVELIESKYDGDLNNLLPKSSTDSSPSEIRARLKEIKGLGDVGIDIFFDTAQVAWPCLGPFLDPRSAKAAEAMGIPSDVQALWATEEVNKDPVKMCKLASALTKVRLDKREGEFK